MAPALLVVSVRDDGARAFPRTDEFAAYLELCVRIRLERTMRFDVFRREVRENERIKVDEAMPILPRALGGHFEDGRRTIFLESIMKEALNEKSTRHRHARQVFLRRVSRLEAYRIDERCFVPCLFEYRVQYFRRTRLSFSACYGDDKHSPRREAIENSTKPRK